MTSETPGSAQDGLGDGLPPGWIDSPGVDGESLDDEQRGQRVEIDFVDARIDQPITQHAERDQTVYGGEEEVVVEHEIESADGSVHKLASRYEDEPPMVFRLFSPINRHPHARAKDDHVSERNRQEGIYVLLMKDKGIEAGHDHRDCATQNNHHGGKPGSKPTEQAVHADLPRTDQSRLSNKEDDPS